MGNFNQWREWRLYYRQASSTATEFYQVELAIGPEDEDKYSFVCPSSAPVDLMDRLGRAIRLTARYAIAQWENVNFDEWFQ